MLMLAMTCALQGVPLLAQDGADAPSNPNGESQSATFEQLCGISDSSPQSAVGLSRSPDGEWSVVTAEKRPGPGDNAAARVWRESNWMVDLHDVPGPTLHAGRLCFGTTGTVILLTDDYMDLPSCGCIRYTAQSFNEKGQVMEHSQRFVSATTGAEIAAPAGAKGFPDVWKFRRVEQLPFYSLLK
jgi:hypothetical protein